MTPSDLATLVEIFRLTHWVKAHFSGDASATIEHVRYVTSNVPASPRMATGIQARFDAGDRTFGRITVDDNMNIVSLNLEFR